MALSTSEGIVVDPDSAAAYATGIGLGTSI